MAPHRPLPARRIPAMLLLAALGAGAAAAPLPSVTDVVYDYAVVGYCGLLSSEVEEGFRRRLAQVTARDGLDPEAARAQRIAGWAKADREWHNRGLGGFRAWCETEGIGAAKRFRAVPRGSQDPVD